MNEEFRLWAINVSAISLSFTNIVDALKITILMVSIAYTAVKLYYLIMDRRRNNGK